MVVVVVVVAAAGCFDWLAYKSYKSIAQRSIWENMGRQIEQSNFFSDATRTNKHTNLQISVSVCVAYQNLPHKSIGIFNSLAFRWLWQGVADVMTYKCIYVCCNIRGNQERMTCNANTCISTCTSIKA